MALSLLGIQTKSVTLFEIRLDQSHLCFRRRGASPSALLKGVLVLCLSEPLTVRSLRMQLTGEKKITWIDPNGTRVYVTDHEIFFRHTWEFVAPKKRSGEVLQPGNYEWPFEHEMPGNCPESVEGPRDTWVIYRMTAELGRGLLQKNFVARKHVRLIRTLELGASELSQGMSISSSYEDKLIYTISTPTKGFIFGTEIKFDIELTPLSKDLWVDRILTQLVETHDLKVLRPKKKPRCHTTSQVIAEDRWKPSGRGALVEIGGQDRYKSQRTIELPRSLKSCTQSANSMGIKIGHSLLFTIAVLNTDTGVYKYLQGTIPVIIFLSPHLPLDETNTLVQQPNTSSTALTSFNDPAPPSYREYQFDQIYSEIDYSGIVTPAGGPSGLNTPFASQSRSGSMENLLSMDAVAPSDVTGDTLQTRLHNLESVERNRVSSGFQESPHSYQNAMFAGEYAGPSAGPSRGIPSRPGSRNRLSRGTLEGVSTPAEYCTPPRIDLSSENLSKVPSYSTALRSRTTAPISDGLPNYQAATQVLAAQPSRPQTPRPLRTQGTPEDHNQ